MVGGFVVFRGVSWRFVVVVLVVSVVVLVVSVVVLVVVLVVVSVVVFVVAAAGGWEVRDSRMMEDTEHSMKQWMVR